MNSYTQTSISIISSVISLGLIGIASYLLKCVLDYKKEFIIFKILTEERLGNVRLTCNDRLEWLRNLQKALVKMNMNIVRIATKMGIQENELDDLTELLSKE